MEAEGKMMNPMGCLFVRPVWLQRGGWAAAMRSRPSGGWGDGGARWRGAVRHWPRATAATTVRMSTARKGDSVEDSVREASEQQQQQEQQRRRGGRAWMDGASGEAASTPKNFEHRACEEAIYRWWEETGRFSPDALPEGVPHMDRRPFVIVMPPPNVTGGLHMGHAIGTTIEDILVRFQRMRGRPTLWLPGTDHAGIATQLLVERALREEGLQRTDLTREQFLERVWAWKQSKGGYITQQLRRLGASADWSRERFTLSAEMSTAVVEAFVRLHQQGLVYRGSYMVNWSPALQTAVSDLEVEFHDERGTLYYFKYPVADGAPDAFLPVATTRPETILGDTAVCVHPNDARYARFIGQQAVVPIVGRRIPVIADEYVDPEFGTGVLKITPAHDPNDYQIGKRHNLPALTVIGKDATMTTEEAGGRYFGLDRFECRQRLWKDMRAAGLVLKEEAHQTRVPRSQRGGEVIEPLISTQWFIRMKPLAERAIEAVRSGQIRILPERFEKIYYGWLEDVQDWCVSRQLWWGHRIPVYYVNSREDAWVVARSAEAAAQWARERYGADVRLEQDPDVLDTWFSSGLWPFSTMGWPDESATDYRRFFPGTVMETGYDILFFWVARMIMLSVALTDRVPFETVYLHGLVRDAAGRKMSKTLGNVIDPLEAIDQYGTDALRMALVTGCTPGQDIPLAMEKVEANRNFANKLWNVARYVLNAVPAAEVPAWRLAEVAQRAAELDGQRLPLPERFLWSRLNDTIAKVSAGLERFAFGDAGQRLYDFLWDDLADWYVEVSKVRLRATAGDAAAAAQRQQTQQTLLLVLDRFLRLVHPFMPFITEAIFQRLPFAELSHGSAALMQAPWPTPSGTVDSAAVRSFERFQQLVRAVRNARATHQVEPARKISATILLPAESAFREVLQAERAVLAALAKIDERALHIVTDRGDAPAADRCAHLIVDDELEAFLPMKGLIDHARERQRLQKQLQRLHGDLEVLHKRLSAPGFVQNAPPSVVQDAQARHRELQETLDSVARRLRQVESDAET